MKTKYLSSAFLIALFLLVFCTKANASDSTSNTAPAKVSPSISTVSSSSLKLTWKKSTLAEKYLIYRASSKTGTFKRISSTSKLSYKDKNLKAGTVYYYKIRAVRKVDDKNIYSPYSKIVSKRTKTAGSFVAKWKVAQKTNQIIAVKASGSTATVTMHQRKSNGAWKQIMSTSGYVGRNGIGKTCEGDGKTPSGTFSIGRAFGVNSSPGTKINYTKVNNSHYWVDDSDSEYYNQFVSTLDVTQDWSSAEHLIKYPTAYAYALHIKYNPENTPGKGSAIFLHCISGTGTSGCVAIPESKMIYVLQHIKSNAKIVIY